jgi:hypothetical protein
MRYLERNVRHAVIEAALSVGMGQDVFAANLVVQGVEAIAGGTCTHRKAPLSHGARPSRTPIVHSNCQEKKDLAARASTGMHDALINNDPFQLRQARAAIGAGAQRLADLRDGLRRAARER